MPPPRPDFESFDATELWCPTCKSSRPVRRRLLLVLPNGDQYEYLCVDCGRTLGSRSDDNHADGGLLLRG